MPRFTSSSERLRKAWRASQRCDRGTWWLGRLLRQEKIHADLREVPMYQAEGNSAQLEWGLLSFPEFCLQLSGIVASQGYLMFLSKPHLWFLPWYFYMLISKSSAFLPRVNISGSSRHWFSVAPVKRCWVSQGSIRAGGVVRVEPNSCSGSTRLSSVTSL